MTRTGSLPLRNSQSKERRQKYKSAVIIPCVEGEDHFTLLHLPGGQGSFREEGP